MDIDQPDDAAHGPVTDPERYLPVVEAARTLVDHLKQTYNVESTTGDQVLDLPESGRSHGEVVRLEPTEGAPLTFMFTDFPGVIARAGASCVQAFPSCGCDACDESPSAATKRLRELVEAAT
ncbi:MAG TPA: DUF6226 family protein [Acidimicrobiia bacterium]|nr:DUF6226 family protein [Acidimicrobiia bacterium]